MKSTNENYKVTRKKITSTQIGLLIQIVLIVAIIVFGIISLLENKVLTVLYSLVAILMFVMAFNNQKVYKRKNVTYFYLIIGVILLIETVMLILV